MKKFCFFWIIILFSAPVLASTEQLFAENGVGLNTSGGNDLTMIHISLDHNQVFSLKLDGTNKANVIFAGLDNLKTFREYLKKGKNWILQNTKTRADGDKLIGDVVGVNGAARIQFMADSSGKASVFLIIREDPANLKSIFLSADTCTKIIEALSEENIKSVMQKLKGKSDMSQFN